MDAEDAGRICVSPAPHHSFQLGPKQKVIAPPTVTRLHRYEWNSNWPRNVQWANGSAMRPDRPAQCLVCQGEGLCGLHLEGLCVCDGGETKSRQVRREFKFQRLRWICCSDKFELASSASRRLRRLCPPVLGCFLERLGVKVIRCRHRECDTLRLGSAFQLGVREVDDIYLTTWLGFCLVYHQFVQLAFTGFICVDMQTSTFLLLWLKEQ